MKLTVIWCVDFSVMKLTVIWRVDFSVMKLTVIWIVFIFSCEVNCYMVC